MTDKTLVVGNTVKYLHSVESFNLRMGIILCFNKNDKDKTRAMGEYVYEV